MSESIQHDELPPEKAFELELKKEQKEKFITLLEELNQQTDKILAKALRKTVIEYKKIISNIDPQFLDLGNFRIEIIHSLFYKAKVESNKERNYPRHAKYENFFYFDLIELKNGSHIPVTQIKPFWREWFEQTKPNKTRDSDFFKCPSCWNTSFYSQWENSCNTCDFPNDYPPWGIDQSNMNSFFEKRKRLQDRRRKRMRRKNFLLKTGLWVFFVKSYVSCPFTMGKYLTKKQVKKWVAGEE